MERIPTVEIFNMPEYTDTVSDQLRLIYEQRNDLIGNDNKPDARIKRDAYESLRELGKVNFKDLTLEYINIKSKVSMLSSAQRQWIVEFIDDCILLTLQIERPLDYKPKTKSK